MKRPPSSTTATLTALVAIVLIVAAAVLFASGEQALERLAVLVGVVGLILPSVTALLRSDQAAEQTNGSLDARIAEAGAAALQARRRSDQVQVVHSDPRPAEPTQPPVDPLTVLDR